MTAPGTRAVAFDAKQTGSVEDLEVAQPDILEKVRLTEQMFGPVRNGSAQWNKSEWLHGSSSVTRGLEVVKCGRGAVSSIIRNDDIAMTRYAGRGKNEQFATADDMNAQSRDAIERDGRGAIGEMRSVNRDVFPAGFVAGQRLDPIDEWVRHVLLLKGRSECRPIGGIEQTHLLDQLAHRSLAGLNQIDERPPDVIHESLADGWIGQPRLRLRLREVAVVARSYAFGKPCGSCRQRYPKTRSPSPTRSVPRRVHLPPSQW